MYVYVTKNVRTWTKNDNDSHKQIQQNNWNHKYHKCAHKCAHE